MYNFSIKFDDKLHSLNSENGISMNLVGDLLKDLYSAIDLDNNVKCTLSNIRGNCYALDFSTEHKDHLDRFVVVHKNIQDVPINDLELEQKKYAKTLGKVMDGKFYVNAYDNEKNKIASINEIIRKKEISYYYSQKTIYGYISELGSKNLDSEKKHVIIDGFPYRIYISSDLDLQLKPFYKTEKLSMKIKIKRSFEKGSIVNAEMISFKEVGKSSLIENLKSEGFIPLNILKDNNNSLEGLLNSIYGY